MQSSANYEEQTEFLISLKNLLKEGKIEEVEKEISHRLIDLNYF